MFATKGDEKIAIEVETGKSDIEANVRKVSGLDCQVIFYAVNRESFEKVKNKLKDKNSINLKVLKIWI